MDLQRICEGVIEETEAVLGCLVFDLDTGLTLASAHRSENALGDAEVEHALRTGAELFRGRFVDQFVQSLATGLISSRGFVREAQVTTAQGYQFMAALPGGDNTVLVLFSEKKLTLGLGWMAVHRAQELLAESQGAGSEVGGPALGELPQPLSSPESQPDAAVDPKPIPPPSEEASAAPLPNPLARRHRRGGAVEDGNSSSGNDETAKTGKPSSPSKKSRRWARDKQ